MVSQFAALIAAAVFLFLASFTGMPVSTTHAIIGGEADQVDGRINGRKGTVFHDAIAHVSNGCLWTVRSAGDTGHILSPMSLVTRRGFWLETPWGLQGG
jgi:hypothetical protein